MGMENVAGDVIFLAKIGDWGYCLVMEVNRWQW